MSKVSLDRVCSLEDTVWLKVGPRLDLLLVDVIRLVPARQGKASQGREGLGEDG